jgi:hypothetical protein
VATGLIGVTEAISHGLCKPTLSVNGVQFSPINPATLARNWSAVVSVDASRCKAKFRGTFEIVFTRLSETAPNMEFREPFIWMPPSVNITVEFGRDEAVERYWIDNVSRAFVGSNGELLQAGQAMPLRVMRAYVRYSTFRRRKKVAPREHVCLVGDRAFRGFVRSCLCRSDSPTCGARVWGTKAKPLAGSPPTALLLGVSA